MAETSSMLALGTPLPRIQLKNAVDGERVDVGALAEGKRGTLVMFICIHCPFVVHVRQELVRVAHEALDRGLAVVAINSNDAATYPQDGPSAMARLARDEGWRFPFLFDDTQEVARAMRAQCTPDLYVFDAGRKLAYRGQLDDSRPSNGKPVTGRDLRAAVEAVAAGRPASPDAEQKPSVGCSIKWRPGS
ncbi:MAG TPA: thioredoxin family protein [Polyangiaceae bacterium]|nr:thioredoxin family protein [Polyangiaceae bacterium]